MQSRSIPATSGALIVGLLIAGCTTAATDRPETTAVAAASSAPSGALSAAEVRSNLIGKQIAWTTCYGRCRGTLFYGADGTATLSGTANGDSLSSRGNWRIAGSQLCVEWANDDGEDGCNSFRWRDAGTVVASNGVVLSL